MRKFALFVGLLTLVLGIGAASAQDMSSIDPSGQTITYWNQYRTDSAQDVAITALVKKFNETNEYGITVEATYQGSYGPIQDLMETAMQSGETPNLVAAYANAAASWALDGFVVDQLTYVNDPTWGFSEEDLADFNETLMKFNVLEDGMMVAWPNQFSAEVLVVNMDTANELGFENPPQSFEDFKAIACGDAGLTAADGTKHKGYGFSGSATEFESFLATLGGDIFDYEAGRYTFDTDESKAVLQLFQDIYSEGCGYFSDQPFGWQVDFNAGLNVSFMNSTAGFTFIVDGFADPNFQPNWSATPLASAPDKKAVALNIPSIALLTSTPEKQLASWVFLKFLSEPENQQAWYTGTGYYPLRKSIAENLPPQEEFVRPDIYPYSTTVLAALSDPSVRLFTTPTFASYSTVRGLEAAAVSDVTVNGMDVAEVAARLEEEANQAHEDTGEAG